jgi:hypothetical protein
MCQKWKLKIQRILYFMDLHEPIKRASVINEILEILAIFQ